MMRKAFFMVGIFIFIMMCGCAPLTEQEYKSSFFAMDTIIDMTVYSEDENAANAAENEIRRIDALLDRGNKDSEIYKINMLKDTDISSETETVIRRSIDISDRCGGAFDITIAPVMDLWGFYDKNYHVPFDTELSNAMNSVGYKNIQLENGKISMPQECSIDLGGVGKGYASDMAVKTLAENHVTSAIISLGGNVYALGKKPNGSDWSVGITDPLSPSQLIGSITVSGKAVVTSGGYQRFFEQNGISYHHIIDPKTGKTAENTLASVTVISESGLEADCLSTALFVMGLDESIEFWRKNNNFDAVFVDKQGNIYITEGIKDMFFCDKNYSVAYN